MQFLAKRTTRAHLINRRKPGASPQFDHSDPFGLFSVPMHPKSHVNHHSPPSFDPTGTVASGPAKSVVPPALPPQSSTSPPLPPAPPLSVPSATHSAVSSSTTFLLRTSSSLAPPSTSQMRDTGGTSTTSRPVDTAIVSQTASSSSTSSGKGNHKTAVAVGITFAIFLVFALGALAWFFRRKREQERCKWRNTWKRGFNGGFEAKSQALHAEDSQAPSYDEKALLKPLSPNVFKPLPDPYAPASLFSFAITAPPNTLNNLINSTPVINPAPISPSMGTGSQGMAHVRRGFLPSLPDELPVNVGEAIHVVIIYDDGWSLCRNGRGETGMVPLECLSRIVRQERRGIGSQDKEAIDARLSKRSSSLYGGISTDGIY